MNKQTTAIALVAISLATTALHGASTLPEEYGKILLDSRIRYEFAEQDGLDAANAATLRVRPGYQTPTWQGFTALAEGEFTFSLNGERDYDAYPGPQGTAGETGISDPRTVELNRLQLAWSNDTHTVVAGRQNVNLDNQRFIGSVNWRQNNQTYDAAAFITKLVPQTELLYAYANRVQRVFGSRAQNEFLRRVKADAHLLHARYTGLKEWGDLAAYYYQVDVDSLASISSNTGGLYFDGKRAISDDLKIIYRAEYAHQYDNGGSAPADFGLNYWHLRTGVDWNGYEFAAGYEELGSDGSFAVQTPLATLHAFNGWADLFLSTPVEGLRDYYLSAKLPLTDKLTVQGALHSFESDKGSIHYGDEVDASVAYKITSQLTATLKGAYYKGDNASLSNPLLAGDVTKFWLQMDFIY